MCLYPESTIHITNFPMNIIISCHVYLNCQVLMEDGELITFGQGASGRLGTGVAQLGPDVYPVFFSVFPPFKHI